MQVNIQEMLKDKIKGAILGQFIGDSLAMPVHWYYDTSRLKKDFGKITTYEAPKSYFPGSILNISNTDGPGRGGFGGNLIGEVILHGKKHLWAREHQYHYHHGMKAGENTLDTLIARQLYRNMIKNKKFDQQSFLSDFVEFMTTPDTHNDVYCNSALRIFFKNFSLGKPLDKCNENNGFDVDSIDNLVILPPIVLANLNSSEEKRNSEIESAIMLNRNSPNSIPYAILYGELLTAAINNENLRDSLIKVSKKLNLDIKGYVKSYEGKNDPVTACYIDDAFPVFLFYAYKYSDDPEKMLLASANGGGENVNRGAILGALIGAQFGISKFPSHLVEGLVEKNGINQEAEDFFETFNMI